MSDDEERVESAGIRARLASVLRPRKVSKASGKSSSKGSTQHRISTESAASAPLAVAPLEAHRERYKDAQQAVDSQLGERRDYTELLHALGRVDAFDSDTASQASTSSTRHGGESRVASLSPELWDMVAELLSPLDAAHLAISSRVLYARLAPRPFRVLDQAHNHRAKITFLRRLDSSLPEHLLCFPCGQYHRRLEPGKERLLSAATQVSRPVFKCPLVRDSARPPPRLAIVPGRTLPFSFVQLVVRHSAHGGDFGIGPESLSRRWRTGDAWQHSSRYLVQNGHLLMKVSSQAFAAPDLTVSGKRMLLFNRDDYAPYWSVCAHWKHGDMTAIAKCALGHVPSSRGLDGLMGLEKRMKDELSGIKGSRVPRPGASSSQGWASQCAECKPLRRCAQCPSEYLVEIKLVEDKPPSSSLKSTGRGGGARPLMPVWRHAIVITRWSDLGDGTSPYQAEWAACAGTGEGAYDGLRSLQKRSLAGRFESALTGDAVPAQRILSLNPKHRHRQGESAEAWY